MRHAVNYNRTATRGFSKPTLWQCKACGHSFNTRKEADIHACPKQLILRKDPPLPDENERATY